jgi:hypothetical protein
MRHTAALFVVAAASLVAGCGGGQAARAPTVRSSTASTHAVSESALKQAVSATLRENHRLALFVLWHNSLPNWARNSTRGPALSSLRVAAAARAKREIRVRLVSDDFHVLSIHLDPSYTKATAIARGRQRVRPYGPNGKPLGNTVALDEHARIGLRRLGSSARFVVWTVSLLR